MLRFHATPQFRRMVSLTSFASLLLVAHLFAYPVLGSLIAAMNALVIQYGVPVYPPFVVWMFLMLGSSAISGIVTDLICGIPSVHDID